MYKWVLTHEVLPGRFGDLRTWFMQQDVERKRTNPNYPRLKRYTTVFGDVHQVIGEVELETFPEDQWNRGWTSGYATIPPEGPQAEFLQLLVPGRSALRLLKDLDLNAQPATGAPAAGMRYKMVNTHEALPGKLPEMKRWFVKQDEERRMRDPLYSAPRRYTTIFGNVHQVVIEFESAGPPQAFVERGYAEQPAEGAQREFLELITPGQSTMMVWKDLIGSIE